LDRLERGGWPAVVETWKKPPVTTEQVLHPDKYAAGEGALAVRLTWSPGGARLLQEGVLGELLVRSLLGGSPAGDAGAAGWGGDAYRVWERDGHWVLAFRSRWDSEAEAAEFLAALEAQRLRSACGEGHALGRFTLYERPGWRAAAERNGDTVTLITSDDPGLLVEALRGLS